MANDVDSFWVFVIGAALGAYFFAAPTNDTKDVTVYYHYCGDFAHNEFSCPTRTYLAKRKFKVSFEKQMVVSSNLFINFKNCSVFDKDNWSCVTAGGTNINMTDGDIYQSNSDSIDEKGEKSLLPVYAQIPRFWYNIKMIGDAFRS